MSTKSYPARVAPTIPDGTADTLRIYGELNLAVSQVQLLEPEYAQLLADPDVVQEDRDATRLLLEHARQNVQEANRALQRVTLGIYGLCIGCGSPIGEERLAAIPHAETCVACRVSR